MHLILFVMVGKYTSSYGIRKMGITISVCYLKELHGIAGEASDV